MPSPKKSILKRIVQTENYQVNWREMFLQVKNFTWSLVTREVHMASLWDAFLFKGIGVGGGVTPLNSAASACRTAEKVSKGLGSGRAGVTRIRI